MKWNEIQNIDKTTLIQSCLVFYKWKKNGMPTSTNWNDPDSRFYWD
jgi:hypothetical protein